MIETLFYLIIFSFIILIGYISLKLFSTVRYSFIERWRTIRKIKKTFKHTKQVFNLEYIKRNMQKAPLISGIINGYELSVELTKRRYSYRYQIQLTSPESFPFSLVISRHNLYDIKHLIVVDDHMRLGRLYIYGSDKAALTGMLDYDVRELINSLNILCMDFNVEGNSISLVMQAENVTEEKLKNIIEKTIKLASCLKCKTDSFKRLVHNAQHDPVPAVRKNNLAVLHKQYKDKKRTHTVLKKALKDKSFEVSIFAAEVLGIDLLTHLIDTIKTAPVRNKIRAIQIIGEEKLKQSINFLIEYYEKTRVFYVKEEVVKTLQVLKFNKFNEFLIKQLRNGISEIKHLAIGKLADCGDRSAIGPLYGIIQDPGVSDFIKQKAEDAIAEIRSRIGDTGEGWLSVAEPAATEGALSLKQSTEEGALSLADAEADKNGSGNE
jgi:hypothetical protein